MRKLTPVLFIYKALTGEVETHICKTNKEAQQKQNSALSANIGISQIRHIYLKNINMQKAGFKKTWDQFYMP